MGRRHLKYDPRDYVLNFARSTIPQVGIDVDGLPDVENGSAADVARALVPHYQAVYDFLQFRQSPATLGKLADCGVGSLENPMAEAELFERFSGKRAVTLMQVMGEDWLDKRDWGRSLLLQLATAALLAAMADVIYEYRLKAAAGELRLRGK